MSNIRISTLLPDRDFYEMLNNMTPKQKVQFLMVLATANDQRAIRILRNVQVQASRARTPPGAASRSRN